MTSVMSSRNVASSIKVDTQPSRLSTHTLSDSWLIVYACKEKQTKILKRIRILWNRFLLPIRGTATQETIWGGKDHSENWYPPILTKTLSSQCLRRWSTDRTRLRPVRNTPSSYKSTSFSRSSKITSENLQSGPLARRHSRLIPTAARVPQGQVTWRNCFSNMMQKQDLKGIYVIPSAQNSFREYDMPKLYPTFPQTHWRVGTQAPTGVRTCARQRIHGN